MCGQCHLGVMPLRPRTRPTIVDVAKRAGVSTATVSYVLNDSAGVGEETRQRVQAAVAELGYQPHRAARSLRHSQFRTLGLIMDSVTPASDDAPGDISSSYVVTEIVRGVERVADPREYSLVYSAAGMGSGDGAPPKILEAGRLDGLLVAGSRFPEEYLQSLAQQFRIPLILVGAAPRETYMDCVLADHERGIRMAVRHLVALGHRRVALINGPPTSLTSPDKEQGFRSVSAELGLQPAPHWVEAADFTVEDGQAAATRLFAQPPFPTAVVTGDDLIALGVMRYLRSAGLAVPGDVSVVGYYDSIVAAHADPPMTTIRVPSAALGEVATRRLTDVIENGPGLPQRVVLPVELVTRQSTAPPPEAASTAEVSA